TSTAPLYSVIDAAGGLWRSKRHSRCPLGRRRGPCLRPWHFQCGGAARTRGAESANRRDHPDRSQQGGAVSRRQGRQRCPQSADSEGNSPEEVCTTKEIHDAEVNVLSMCGGPGPRQVLWPSLATRARDYPALRVLLGAVNVTCTTPATAASI